MLQRNTSETGLLFLHLYMFSHHVGITEGQRQDNALSHATEYKPYLHLRGNPRSLLSGGY